MAKNRFQGKDGPSQRQLRVGELIRRTMSELLQRGEVHDPDLQRMSITVGEVRMTPDLSIATCFVLPLGGKDADLAIAALAKNKGELRHLISRGMKLKVTPDLRFRIDDMYDRMDATREMFAVDRVAKDVAAPDTDEEEMMRWLAGLFLLATPAAADLPEVPCDTLEHLGASYTVCEVLASDDVQLFLRDDAGDILGSFSAVEEYAGRDLMFAMNAGMYHPDRDPVGHYIEDGVEEMRVISSDGPGNFGLLPNGVFCINDELRVYETLDYLARAPECAFASQSGPMLLINGNVHPRFIENSDSLNIRNGVGTSADGSRAVFAISNEAVNFHDFATLFRDRIKLPDALFFDGSVSRMYATSINRSDFGWQLGPIVGVLVPVDAQDATN